MNKGLCEREEPWAPLVPHYINNMKLDLIRKNSVLTACTLGDSIDFSCDQLLESPMLPPMPMRRFTLPIEQTATDLLPSMELRDFSE